jgi:hypothetical protein
MEPIRVGHWGRVSEASGQKLAASLGEQLEHRECCSTCMSVADHPNVKRFQGFAGMPEREYPVQTHKCPGECHRGFVKMFNVRQMWKAFIDPVNDSSI